MPENQKNKIKRRGLAAGLALLALGLLVLSACGGQPKPDAKMYDFVYASGYSRDPYTRDAVQPVIDSTLRLTVAAEDGQTAALQFLDAQGGLLYSLADFQPEAAQKSNLNLTVRAEAASRGLIIAAWGIFLPYTEENAETADQGAIWLCSEAWAKSPYNGYIDGLLRGGKVMLLNAQTGQKVFSADTQPGELFLTAYGRRCYFYYPGKAARRKVDSCPAQIYWRDINCWPLKHTVCSFDYIGTPEIDGQEMERLRFYPQADENTLRLDFTCYEQTNVENDRWDYVVKQSVEVPLVRQPQSGEE